MQTQTFAMTPNKNRSGIERKDSKDGKDPKMILKSTTSSAADLGAIKAELAGLNEKYHDVVVKLDCLVNMMERISTLEGQVGMLNGNIARLEEENRTKSETIKNLQGRLNQNEQYSRKETIEIREVPQTSGENVDELVVSLARKLSVNLSINDISSAHRLKAARGKTPAIIVRFVSRRKKEELMARKGTVVTRGELVRDGGSGRVYLGDSLSPHYKQLLWKSREKAKGLGYKYVWWKGSVCVRKTDVSAVVKITSEEDLDLII